MQEDAIKLPAVHKAPEPPVPRLCAVAGGGTQGSRGSRPRGAEESRNTCHCQWG